MTTLTQFTSRDLDVLNLLFDSEAQPTIDSRERDKPTVTRNLRPEETSEINNLEHQAIQLAEQGSLKKAEELLTHAISKYPTERCSLWNNRAQVKRLQGDIRGALDDLSQVIQILTSTTKNGASTQEDIKVLSQAHIHRATIYMLLAKGEMNAGGVVTKDSETLEGLASQDFVMAGKYGSELGRAMGVRTNPYAKMCGAIVQTALMKEMEAGL
jgi:tetratricopeptide (TPR) repeat protein